MNHLRGFLDSFLVTHTEPQAAHLDPMKTVHKHNMPQHQTALNLPKSWGVVYSGLPLQQQQLCPFSAAPHRNEADLLRESKQVANVLLEKYKPALGRFPQPTIHTNNLKDQIAKVHQQQKSVVPPPAKVQPAAPPPPQQQQLFQSMPGNPTPYSMPAGNLGPQGMPAPPYMPVGMHGGALHSQGVPGRPQQHPMQSQGAMSHPGMNTSVPQPVGAMHRSQYAVAAAAPTVQNNSRAAAHSLVADIELDSDPDDNEDGDMWDDAAFACIDAAVNRRNQSDTHNMPVQQPAASMQFPAHSQPAYNTQIQHQRMPEGSFPPAVVNSTTA